METIPLRRRKPQPQTTDLRPLRRDRPGRAEGASVPSGNATTEPRAAEAPSPTRMPDRMGSFSATLRSMMRGPPADASSFHAASVSASDASVPVGRRRNRTCVAPSSVPAQVVAGDDDRAQGSPAVLGACGPGLGAEQEAGAEQGQRQRAEHLGSPLSPEVGGPGHQRVIGQGGRDETEPTHGGHGTKGPGRCQRVWGPSMIHQHGVQGVTGRNLGERPHMSSKTRYRYQTVTKRRFCHACVTFRPSRPA